LREDSEGGVRSSSKTPRDKSGIRDESMGAVVTSMRNKSQQKFNKKLNRIGEGDRVITTKKPKHLFSGKRKMGKTDRR
jgi:nucleolar GTP-binding protein